MGARRSAAARVLAVAVVAAVAALAFTSGAGAHLGSSAATEANDGSHPWSTDGCSLSPNSLLGVYNFRHPCRHHDGCYRGHSRTTGKSGVWVTRLQCDVVFLADMQASCNYKHSFLPVRALCYEWATKYYVAVRAFAQLAYKGPAWMSL